MTRRFPRFARLIPWALALAILLSLAGPAASSMAAVIEASPTSVAAQATSYEERTDPDHWEPLYRWAPSLGDFHSKTNWADIGAATENSARKAFTSYAMAFTHMLWIGVSELTRFAIGFEPINAIGGTIDNSMASVLDAIISPSGSGAVPIALIGVLFAVAAALIAAARAGRGRPGGVMKRLMGVMTILAILTLMSFGAKSTTTDGEYSPGVFSPGWFVKTSNEAIVTVATGVTGAFNLNSFAPATGIGADAMTSAGDFSCSAYIDNMQMFRNHHVHAGGLKGDSAPTWSAGYGATDMIGGIWADLALPAFVQAQFGNETNLGPRVYCHLLEQRAGIPAAERSSILNNTLVANDYPSTSPNYNAPGVEASPRDGQDSRMFVLDPVDNREEDVAYVGWALCQTNDAGATWFIHDEASSYINANRASNDSNGQSQECMDWWSGSMAKAGGGAPFDVAENPKDDDLVNTSSSKGMNFFNSLHGVNGAAMASIGTMVSYTIGSTLATVVLLVVVFGVLLAKLMSIFFLVGFIISLVVGIFRADGWQGIGASFMQMLGTQVVAAGALFLLSLLLMFTRVLMDVGASIFGPGEAFSLLWSGMSPLLAVIGLNLIIKKLFKIPSPFSLKGGLAFATAAGAIGGSIGGSIAGRAGGGGGESEVGGRDISTAAKESLGLDALGRGSRGPRRSRDGSMGFDGGLRQNKQSAAVHGIVTQGHTGVHSHSATAAQHSEAKEYIASHPDKNAPGVGVGHRIGSMIKSGTSAGRKGAGAVATPLSGAAASTGAFGAAIPALIGGSSFIAMQAARGNPTTFRGKDGIQRAAQDRGGVMAALRQRTNNQRMEQLAAARGIDLSTASSKTLSSLSEEARGLPGSLRKQRLQALTQKARSGTETAWQATSGSLARARRTTSGLIGGTKVIANQEKAGHERTFIGQDGVERTVKNRAGMINAATQSGHTARISELAKRRGIDLKSLPSNDPVRKQLSQEASALGKARRQESRQNATQKIRSGAASVGSGMKSTSSALTSNTAKNIYKGVGAAALISATGGVAAPFVAARATKSMIQYGQGAGERKQARIDYFNQRESQDRELAAEQEHQREQGSSGRQQEVPPESNARHQRPQEPGADTRGKNAPPEQQEAEPKQPESAQYPTRRSQRQQGQRVPLPTRQPIPEPGEKISLPGHGHFTATDAGLLTPDASYNRGGQRQPQHGAQE